MRCIVSACRSNSETLTVAKLPEQLDHSLSLLIVHLCPNA